MEDFPSNSQRPPARKEVVQAPAVRHIQAVVVDGAVTKRKRPLHTRIRDAFLGDDDRTILEFVIQDIIKPSLRDMSFEVGQSALERVHYGSARPFRRGGGGMGAPPGGPRNYNSISRGDPRPVVEARTSRRSRDFDELIVNDRANAQSILEGMYAILDEYGTVTVSDMYQLAKQPTEFTDRDWGWTDLMGAPIRRVREGWLIDLPRPDAIK